MPSWNLPLHQGLFTNSRLRQFTGSMTWTRSWEWLVLLSSGIFSAVAVSQLDFSLRIPGHAILRAVFPMAMGMAIVPRRGSGTIIGLSALGTIGVIALLGHALPGRGALVSMSTIGPLTDLSIIKARRGWQLYLGFAIAGLTSNLIAFLVKGSAKLGHFDGIGKRTLFDWLPQASFTYLVCGIVAGFISGAVWFAAKPRKPEAPKRKIAEGST